jgi:hypothetical protein
MCDGFDYPSQAAGVGFGPPAPMLLDTCVVQHVASVFTLTDESWTEEAVQQVRQRYPQALAVEILALGDLVFLNGDRGDGPLWAASSTARAELARVGGLKGARLQRWWQDLADYWEGVAEGWPDCPQVRFDDERCVSPHQLALKFVPPVHQFPAPYAPAFGPFADAGDRALIREAIRGGFPAILTTDIRSFWRFRSWLYPHGLEVWRPSDAWQAMGGLPGDLLAA